MLRGGDPEKPVACRQLWLQGWHPSDGGLWLCAAACALSITTSVCGQNCGPQWLPSDASQALNKPVSALVLAPNGDVIAAGGFTDAGGAVGASYVAAWNGVRWRPLGLGVGGGAVAAAVGADGTLVVAGGLKTAGGLPAKSVAAWDGLAWRPLDATFSANIRSLLVLPDRSVIAGFWEASSDGLRTIARWNGARWQAMGTGLLGQDCSVEALARTAAGGVLAAGAFVLPGNLRPDKAAVWDGSTWSVPSGGMNGPGWSLLALPDGSTVVGGYFSLAGGTAATSVARLTGTTWSPMGEGLRLNGVSDGPGTVYALAQFPSGQIVAGGLFDRSGTRLTARIARWDGQRWLPLGTGTNGTVRALAVHRSGELVAGGQIFRAGPHSVSHFARWTDTGAPWVAEQPASMPLSPGATLTLSATPANGYDSVHVRWMRNGLPISDGPGGAAPGGGTVVGSLALLPSPTESAVAVLTIEGATCVDAGAYSAEFFNACGSAVSDAALVVAAACGAVCGADYTGDGVLSADDLGDFVTDYFAEPALSGPGGYAVPCPGLPPPYDLGFRAAFTSLQVGQCGVPFSDNLGDFIRDYFEGCEGY